MPQNVLSCVSVLDGSNIDVPITDVLNGLLASGL